VREFFASGHAVDVVLLMTAAEAVVMSWLWRRHRPAIAAFLRTLVAGAFLLLALRVALTGGAWPWIAAALMGSGVAHAADLRGRWAAPT
jgi:hypothetical protein